MAKELLQNRTATVRERVFSPAYRGTARAPEALISILVTLSAGPVRAAPPPSSEVIPAEVVAAYFSSGPGAIQRLERSGDHSSPARGSGVGEALELVGFLADHAFRVGLLSEMDTSNRMWVDAFAALPAVQEHPYAVVLLDIRASQRTDGGHELAGLHAALVVNTGGKNDKIERRIRHLLNTYTNTADTELTEQSADGRVVFTLRDRRLPAWVTITWGRMGDYFVVAVGDGSFERIVTARKTRPQSLAADPWFAGALDGVAMRDPSVMLYIRFSELKRDADASLAEKIGNVQTSLGLADVERALLTAGRNGRAVEIRGFLRRRGLDEAIVIAGQELLAGVGEAVVPEDAGGYAAFGSRPLDVLRAIRDAYLAAKSSRARQRSRAFWRDLESGAGISIERDIFARLDGPILIHDYPRHALRLPFAWTILIPVKGDAAALRDHVDRFLESITRRLDEESRLRLRREPCGVAGTAGDGDDAAGPGRDIWYVQYGLTGPGLTVTDRWLVLGFSPYAVRANVAFLASQKTLRR